ncbi:MAG TPA: DUF1178 family protein [Caulobacteraceae bacterium]|jgi:hypothetical protein|nr:DUF1178 family protein [Caulobacteraceae bacterium]
MIRYALACQAGHEFEGWFAASADYDVQSAAGDLACPVCDSREVGKQIMAPAVTGGRNPAMSRMMSQVRAHVEANFDYVGDRFAAEARQIHAGEAEVRGIYGEASPAEVKALVADGVPVAPLPPAAPRKTEVN